MGKKERAIKALIAEYYEENNQFHEKIEKITEEDMKIIEYETPEQKQEEKITNLVYTIQNILIDYVENAALDLCEYLDDINLENYINFTLESTRYINPSYNLQIITEKPIQVSPITWHRPPPPELSKKNKKRFGTYEKYLEYCSNCYIDEISKKENAITDATTIIIRSIIIPLALRIKLEWPERLKRRQKEEEQRKLKKWEEDDQRTVLIAIENSKKRKELDLLSIME